MEMHGYTCTNMEALVPTSAAKSQGPCQGRARGLASLTFWLPEPKPDGRIPSRKLHVKAGVVLWKVADDGQGFAGLHGVNGAKERLDALLRRRHGRSLQCPISEGVRVYQVLNPMRGHTGK